MRDVGNGVISIDQPGGIVLIRSAFHNTHAAIYLQGGGEGWYIADKTIVGDTFYATES